MGTQSQPMSLMLETLMTLRSKMLHIEGNTILKHIKVCFKSCGWKTTYIQLSKVDFHDDDV